MENKKRVILKEHKETFDEKVLHKYGRKLEQKGWVITPIEGGYLSPDCSTIFIVGRSPYFGQLIQYSANKETEYNNIAQELITVGDFIEY